MGAGESIPVLDGKRQTLTFGIFSLDPLRCPSRLSLCAASIDSAQITAEMFVKHNPSAARLRDLIDSGSPVIIMGAPGMSQSACHESLRNVISLLFTPFALKRALGEFKEFQTSLGATKVEPTLDAYVDSCFTLETDAAESVKLLFEQKLKVFEKKSVCVVFEIPPGYPKLKAALVEQSKSKNVKISVIEREL